MSKTSTPEKAGFCMYCGHTVFGNPDDPDIERGRAEGDGAMSEFCADQMTLDEFIASCRAGVFVDSDGTGYYATATEESDKPILPSDALKGKIDRSYTHVCWYNR